MITAIGSSIIEHDPETTRRCYAQIAWGDDCDCGACRNLDALGSSGFPAIALEIFDRLGIDWHKPAEAYHCGRLENGLHDYGAWYHCVGRILSDTDTSEPKATASTLHHFDVEALPEHFHIGCSSGRDLAPKAFDDFPLVQVGFTAELPWVLDEPEWT